MSDTTDRAGDSDKNYRSDSNDSNDSEARLARYLSERAQTIPLQLANPDRIVARATRRRQRRRVALGAVAVLAVIGTTVGLLADRDHEQTITLARPELSKVPASAALDWTVVRQRDGLGFTQATTVTDDGTFYALSSAPGVMEPDTGSGRDTRAVLYRSKDGLSWNTVPLPEKIWATNLAAGGGRVYAVGTAPGAADRAGSGGDVVVNALGRDGGWNQTTLPLHLDALTSRYPEVKFSINRPSIAAGAAGVLVAVLVRTNVALDTLIRQRATGAYDTWFQTKDGVDVYKALDDKCPVPPKPDIRGDSKVDVGAVVCGGDGRETRLVRRFSWADLDVAPDLEPFMLGQLRVFWSPDGTTFEPVDVPVETGSLSWVNVVASSSGYELLYETADPSSARLVAASLSSADGRSWRRGGFEVADTSVLAAGVIGDAPAAVVSSVNGGQATLEMGSSSGPGAAGGSWTSLDLVGALGIVPPDAQVSVHQAAIGPLGAVALVNVIDGKEGGVAHQWIVHSPDGQRASALPLDRYFGPVDPYRSYNVVGITVTADAVIVRVSDAPEKDRRTSPPQQLLIGTPPR